jgi:hypothetical protein
MASQKSPSSAHNQVDAGEHNTLIDVPNATHP